jgi:melibiose permease/lactose/raffinose/galactose permease
VTFKAAMLILPMVIIALGFVLYRFKFKIDEKFYAEIIGDLKKRGDIQ